MNRFPEMDWKLFRSKIADWQELGMYCATDDEDSINQGVERVRMSKVPISSAYVSQFEKLLAGGIWCIVQLGYGEEGMEAAPGEIYDSHGDKNSGTVIVEELTPY